MNSYTFMVLDDVEEGEEISSQIVSYVKEFSCGGSKAPGPDALVPKVNDPLTINDFRIDVGKDKVNVSHLQSADDALIIGEWSRTNIKNLSRILTCFDLASGLKVRNSPLWYSFPRLFRLESQPNCRVCDRAPAILTAAPTSCSVQRGDGPYIGPQLELPRSPVDLNEILELESLIYNLQITSNHDNWECLIDPSRNFMVKGMRNAITNTSMPSNPSLTRWNKLVPIKVNIASWRIENRRIPTQVNLDLRGIDLHSVRCSNCDEDLETEEHLLVNCTFAKNTWLEIIKWWNIRDVHMDNLNDVFSLENHANLPPVLSNMLDAVV
nr:reverse transcriptase domain, reverse transcriptase zinc-binding domain protein [Tanacetum cinerariifolium]